MIGHSHSGQNSRRAANGEREVGQPSIIYQKRRLYTETVGGPRRSGFTSTPVPRYSGESNWDQYREVFEAIVS